MAQYLDKAGLGKLWTKIKELVSTNVSDKLGVANGIATLGSDSKLTASQLPSLKTVNGESIVGSGNIAIDLNIYQVVESLPESNQNPNKIYLVLSGTQGEQNVYTEYAWINNGWEKLGEYKAEIELSGYLTKEFFDGLFTSSNTSYLADRTKPGLMGYRWVDSFCVDRLVIQGNSSLLSTSNDGITINLKTKGFNSDGTSSSYDYTNATIPMAKTDSPGLLSSTLYNKLNAITAEATKDEAITSAELDEILV